MNNKDEYYWNILLKNIEWIKFSESKSGVLITIYGIIVTIVYSNANSVFSTLSESVFLAILCGAIIFASLIAIYFSFKAINPVLKNDNPNSIIYYGHISSQFKNHIEYLEEANKILDDESLRHEQMAEQVYITSVIAWRKFKNVSLSIRYFLISLALTFGSVIYYLIAL